MTKLKELRDKAGFSQAELAKMVGVSSGAIGNYEQGTREPNIETLAKIAIVLDVTIDELVEFRKLYDQLHDELHEKILEKEKEPKN